MEHEAFTHSELDSLAEFFDLLARFDFEDKQASEPEADPLISAPKGSASNSDAGENYGAEIAT